MNKNGKEYSFFIHRLRRLTQIFKELVLNHICTEVKSPQGTAVLPGKTLCVSASLCETFFGVLHILTKPLRLCASARVKKYSVSSIQYSVNNTGGEPPAFPGKTLCVSASLRESLLGVLHISFKSFLCVSASLREIPSFIQNNLDPKPFSLIPIYSTRKLS